MSVLIFKMRAFHLRPFFIDGSKSLGLKLEVKDCFTPHRCHLKVRCSRVLRAKYKKKLEALCLSAQDMRCHKQAKI